MVGASERACPSSSPVGKASDRYNRYLINSPTLIARQGMPSNLAWTIAMRCRRPVLRVYMKHVVIPNSGDFAAEEQPEAFMAEFRHFFSE
jgi:hypothetical protein